MTARTLVLGLGNVLVGDDGLGVWVVERLRRRFVFPDSVTLLEGGTLGLDLLPRLEGVERLLLVDAVSLGRPPGALIRLEGDEVPAALDQKLSSHQIGLPDLLAAARLMGTAPPTVVLLGLGPERLEAGTAFSASVAGALPRLEARVLDELSRWGTPGRPLEEAAPLAVWWTEPAAAGPP